MYDVMVPNDLLEKADALLSTIQGVVKSEDPNKYVCESLESTEAFSRAVFVD